MIQTHLLIRRGRGGRDSQELGGEGWVCVTGERDHRDRGGLVSSLLSTMGVVAQIAQKTHPCRHQGPCQGGATTTL